MACSRHLSQPERNIAMKNIGLFLGAGLVSMVAGCTSTPVALAPVGPNPSAFAGPAASGRLQVYSSLVGHSEGNNPTWYQHTGYYVYDAHGALVERVANTVGRYDEAPRQVKLAPGQYRLKARANDYFWVEVPVIIERGQTTRVHLDDHWQVPSNASKADVVSLPDGNPVGWRAEGARVPGA